MPLDDRKFEYSPRPEIDRDKLALSVQKDLGRVLSWDEYRMIWNAATAWMAGTGVRDDYLIGQDE